MKGKLVHFDIETTPLIGYAWRPWQTDLIEVIEDWQLLCVCYKWETDKSPVVMSWRTHTEEQLAEEMYHVLHQADIVVAHNGDRFDIRKVNTKLLEFGLAIPSPFKTVDTLKIAKNHFGFTRNKLDSIGEFLKVGKKLPTDFQLWKDCMAGDNKALKRMERYNKQDVLLLEKVYKLLAPWTPRHPNRAVGAERPTCGTCGSEKVYKDGFYRTNTQVYQAWECQDCGAWMRSRGVEGTNNADKLIVADRK